MRVREGDEETQHYAPAAQPLGRVAARGRVLRLRRGHEPLLALKNGGVGNLRLPFVIAEMPLIGGLGPVLGVVVLDVAGHGVVAAALRPHALGEDGYVD